MSEWTDVLGGEREILVGGVMKVVYNPAEITPEIFHRITAGAKSEDPELALQAYEETFPKLIVSWDAAINGVPVPLTAEAMRNVPIEGLDLVFEAIMADRANRRSAEGNASGSSTAASAPASTTPTSTENPQDGSGTLPQPVSTDAVPGSS